MLDKSEQLIATLFSKGVKKIDFPYSGSGDEGFIDSLEIVEGDPLKVLLSAEEREILQDVAYGHLETEYGGWEVNEGGFGMVHLTLKPDGSTSYIINHHSRYSSYDESSSSGED